MVLIRKTFLSASRLMLGAKFVNWKYFVSLRVAKNNKTIKFMMNFSGPLTIVLCRTFYL